MDNPGDGRITTVMVPDHDILIVGGGLNGPALALALAQAGLSVGLIDAQAAGARAEAGFDGRAYALSIASRRLLEGIGVWATIADLVQPIVEIRTSDGRAGEAAPPFFLHFQAAEIEEGPMGFMLEDRHIHGAFLQALGRYPGIRHVPGRAVVAQSIGPATAEVTLDNGEHLSGRVIAGCDGRASGTAERAGITRTGWGYGQTAIVCAVAHDLPHDGIAEQIFLPQGPLAILPLKGNRSSIVWSETDADARAIMALDDAAFMAVLSARTGDRLGGLRPAGKRFTYPLNLTLADRYVSPRIALVGDAAHGVHPIAGQGLNLGFRDVGALAEVLVDAMRRGEDIGSVDVLERYQRWRRFDSTALALGMDTVNTLFSNDNPALRLARDAGMGLVGAFPALRRAFIRQAAGLSGDVPKLLAGKPL